MSGDGCRFPHFDTLALVQVPAGVLALVLGVIVAVPRGRIPLCRCSQPWAAMPNGGSSTLMGRVGQTSRQSAGEGGVLLLSGTCLKIPSTGQEAPPVRRRRFLGGVRVIHVPQVWCRFVDPALQEICFGQLE